MIRTFVLIYAFLIGQVTVWAQECSGPMRLVVGFSSGGGADNVARTLAKQITIKFGRTVIVENKAGAGGNIAAEYVAKAPPDGCTLIIRGNEHQLNTLIQPKPGYALRDFVPVARVTTQAVLIVANPNAAFKTVAGLIEYAKANPGKLPYGATGIGGGTHVAMELFMRATGTQMVRIQYKGGAASIVDTAAGVLPIAVTSVSVAMPLVAAGKVTPLVVTTPSRWPGLPNVPTVTEAGYPDATMVYWLGVLAPAGTPLPVREKLNREFLAVLEESSVRERMLAQGLEAAPSSLQEFDKFLRDDLRVSSKLMQEIKLKID
jgi:tripartite-type tricarboxylate transporter receptor subunit TctC